MAKKISENPAMGEVDMAGGEGGKADDQEMA